MCESCSFTCNSKKNVLIIGATNNADLNELISGNHGLMHIVRQMDGQLESGIQLTPTRSIRTLPGNEIGDSHDVAVRAAIVETSLRETMKLMQVNESLEDGWKKFLLAQEECNLDLDSMCKESEPLSQADVNKLDKAIDKVAKYYLSAIYLWKVFFENDFNDASIKRHSQLAAKQVKYVTTQLKKKHKFKGVDNFWKLNVKVQKIFMDGAVKYFKDRIHDYCRVVRTSAFHALSLARQNSHDNLHDRVFITVGGRRTQQQVNPPLGEHKGENTPQIAYHGAYLGDSPLSRHRGIKGEAPPKITKQQTLIMETSTALVRRSVAGSALEPSFGFGASLEDREDSSFVPRVPPSPNDKS